MNRAALIITLIGITIFACKKAPSSSTIAINGELKAAFNFQPGSYWIYKDSISGALDSFVVTFNHVGNTFNSPYSINYITIDISEYTLNTIAPKYTQHWNLSYQSDMIDLEFDAPKTFVESIYYSPLVNYPYLDCLWTCGGCIVEGLGQSNIVGIFNTLSVNSMVYVNVAEIHHAVSLAPFDGYGEYDTDDLFFVSPNVGIIKMNLNHPQDSVFRVFELQRYHIVK